MQETLGHNRDNSMKQLARPGISSSYALFARYSARAGPVAGFRLDYYY
jgi:hypothetical protein